MPVGVCRRFAVAIGAGLAVLALIGGPAASAASSPKNSIRALIRQTKVLPPGAVSKVQQRKLNRAATNALRASRRQPCAAVAQLVRYRRILGTIKVKSGRRFARARARLAALGPSSLKASQQLLGDRRTRRCGGGVRQSTLKDTKTTVMSSDENGMRVRVQLPVLRLVPETGGGKTWTKLVAPNTDSPGQPGTPGIPTVSSTFGVPDGATLKVGTGKTESYKLDGVDLFPAQPDPVDGPQSTPPPDFTKPPFATPPFTIDKEAYNHRGSVPAEPADGAILGTARDIVIGNLRVPSAQYNPRTKTLQVIKSVEVTLQFQGGPHTFSNELGSPWESAQRRLVASLLNFAIVRRPILELIRRCGEEMLVITNPATRAAADTFATARRAAGIRTSVFETGAAPSQIGTTPAAIQTFVRARLTQLGCIHPSYVTIMGDDDLVPTFAGINGIPSDLQYSMKNDVDELPDVAVGRIIGNDQAAVGTAVTKIVNYETTPPTGNGMLSKALIAAQFQDDNADGRENRTFIQFAETVRNGLVARGVAVDRVYGDHPTATPLQFNDGTPLPAALLKPTFPWTGSGADVTAGWNQGRFMVIHRDHGWSDGWGTPGFGTADVNALTNGANLPVVLSVNCSSGAYDYDETSFAGESLVKANGGSVGVFGDTRDSPTWHNTQIALGFVDGLLPSVLPAEGPAFKQRTGDALITGKLRLAGLAPPATDGSTRNELYLWHYFGDPSMQMWGGGNSPLVFDPSRFLATYRAISPPNPGDPPFEVVVTLPAELAGQSISLLRNGDVIGKATVNGDGKATIPAAFGDGSVKPGDLTVAIEPDGGQKITAPVGGVPEPTPPGPADTTLTSSCSPDVDFNADATTSGHLTPSFAGATVKLIYTRPDETTFERTTTTDANGNWTNTISTDTDWPSHGGGGGQWQVEAGYAGDTGHKPSAAPACTFTERGG
jgi:hypothetical protein